MLHFNYCRKKPLLCILELLKWPKFKIKMKRVQIKCITLPISRHSGLCAKIKPYKNRPQRLKIRADKQFPSEERALQKSLWSVWKFQRAVRMHSDAQCEKQDVWLTPPTATSSHPGTQGPAADVTLHFLFLSSSSLCPCFSFHPLSQFWFALFHSLSSCLLPFSFSLIDPNMNSGNWKFVI